MNRYGVACGDRFKICRFAALRRCFGMSVGAALCGRPFLPASDRVQHGPSGNRPGNGIRGKVCEGSQNPPVILSVSEGSRALRLCVLFTGFFAAARLRMTGGCVILRSGSDEGAKILWLRCSVHGILHRCAVQNDRWIVKCCTQDGVAALFWETCRAGACSRRFLASDRIQRGRFVKRPYFRTPIPIRRGDSRIARLPQYRLPAMSNTGRLQKNNLSS